MTPQGSPCMPRYGYKLLLVFLRVLVYLKRVGVWLFQRLALLFNKTETLYRNTIGFRVYKLLFTATKKLGIVRRSPSGKFVDLFSRRGSLQVVLFLIGVTVMIPHSKLYTRDNQNVVGRDTLLYSLVGPGDMAFEIEEVTPELFSPSDIVTPAWREGAISSENTEITLHGPLPQDITSLVSGSGAVTKPTIITGADIPTASNVPSNRTEIVQYTVQPGDVIGVIASQYGVSVETILWANNLTARSYIRPGDILKILPTSGVVHTVKKGDTVSKIARLYDAPEAEIINANRLQEGGKDIVVGEDLIVPGGEKPQPVYVAPRNPTFSSIAAPLPSITAPAGSGYLWPAGVRRITQYFGLRHDGVDIGGPLGTPLYAARAGVVNTSKCGWNGGYGCYIILDHGDGVQTLYGHAADLFVAVGDEVAQGQNIASMGSTGNSTGPHVHFEVRINKKKQNPLQYVR